MIRNSFICVALAVGCVAPAQAANLVVNGSFETGAAPGAFTTYNAPSAFVPGWTLSNGSIDYIGSYWAASDGSRSLDMAGCCSVPGTISQSFATVAGTTYKVSFDLWANPDGGSDPRLLYADVGAGNLTFSSNGGGSKAAPNWISQSFTFTAMGPSTTLSFIGDGPSSTSNNLVAFGAALDNVSVSAVPEPASWAFMIAGFGLAGGALRRRNHGLAQA